MTPTWSASRPPLLRAMAAAPRAVGVPAAVAGGVKPWHRALCGIVLLLAAAQPLPAAAQPESPPPSRSAANLRLVVADILRSREVAGGYALTLEPVRLPEDEPALTNAFEATLALPALPASGRLFLVVDIADRERPAVQLWSFVLQHVCLLDDLVNSNGLRGFFEGGWVEGTGDDQQLCARF